MQKKRLTQGHLSLMLGVYMGEKIKRIKTKEGKNKWYGPVPPESAKVKQVDPHIFNEDFTDVIAYGDAGAFLDVKEEFRRSIENATRSHGNDNEAVEPVAETPVGQDVEPNDEEPERIPRRELHERVLEAERELAAKWPKIDEEAEPATEEQEERPEEAGALSPEENEVNPKNDENIGEVLTDRKKRKFEAEIYLDRSTFENHEAIVKDLEKKGKDLVDIREKLIHQFDEAKEMRESLNTEHEDLRNRSLGKKSYTDKIRKKAEAENDELDRRMKSIRIKIEHISTEIEENLRTKEVFQQKIEAIRIRATDRIRAFVSPLEAGLIKFDEEGEVKKADDRIDHFMRQHASYSKRLFEIQQTINNTSSKSTRLWGKNVKEELKKSFDHIETKLDHVKKQREALIKRRAAIESQIREWKKLGEAFEKKIVEPVVAEPTEAVPAEAIQHPVSGEATRPQKAEVTPELQRYMDKWKLVNPDMPMSEGIAEWIPKHADRPINQHDFERGVSEYFTVRRRGIRNWPVISWVADLLLKRRIAKLQKGN